MVEITTQVVQKNNLEEVVSKLIPQSIGKDPEKACQLFIHSVMCLLEK